MKTQRQQKFNRILIGFLLSILFFLQPAWATWPPPPPSDANWQGLRTTTSGPISSGGQVAHIADNGDIYVAGPVGSAVHVAKWSFAARKWEVLGERLRLEGSPWTAVTSMVVDANGDVYVGGEFNRADNSSGTPIVTLANIARWDAAAGEWKSVGEGTSERVNALAMKPGSDTLYVGGMDTGFNPDGSGVTLNHIGIWDITSETWHPLGQGVDNVVIKMVVNDANKVFIAGYFEVAIQSDGTTLTVNNTAHWDGNQWQPMGQGITPLFSFLHGIAIDKNGEVYLAGTFQNGVNSNGTTAAGPIIRWDGSQWISLTPPANSFLLDIACDHNNDVYLLFVDDLFEGPFVDRWDGTNWDRLGKFGGETVNVIAANPNYNSNRVYVSGLFFWLEEPQTGAVIPYRINAYYQGSRWFGMVGVASAAGTVLATSAHGENIYVGGHISDVDGMTVRHIARYNGVAWDSVGGGTNGPVHAIRPNTRSGGYIVVGGEFNEVLQPDGSALPANNIAIWKQIGLFNEGWLNVGGGVDGPVYAVYADFFPFGGGGFLGSVIVAGKFTTAFNDDGTAVPAKSIAKYDFFTKTWTPIGGGVYGGSEEVRTLTTRPNDFGFEFYFGGSFDGVIDNNGVQIASPNIVFHDIRGGGHWTAIGQGVDGPVNTLAYNGYGRLSGDARIWVGGEFSTATNENGSQLTTPYVAVWNGNTNQWNSLGGGVDGPVYDIEPVFRSFFAGAYIGGDFTLAYYANGNARAANNVILCSLDPPLPTVRPLWNELGSGTNGPVHAMTMVRPCYGGGEIVYIGGDFSVVGNRNTKNMGRWKYNYNPQPTIHHVAASGGSGGSGNSVSAVLLLPPCYYTNSKQPETLVNAFDSLAFGESVTLDSLPLYDPIDIKIYDVDQPGTPILQLDSTVIGSGLPMQFFLMGVDDTLAYAPNPDGHSTKLRLAMKPQPAKGDPNNVTVLFVHAITDAPTLDIYDAGGNLLVSGLDFGEIHDPVTISPSSHILSLHDPATGNAIGNYDVDLTGMANQFASVSLRGFLDPAANQNGPGIGMTVTPSLSAPIVGLENDLAPGNLPDGFRLAQNYPNPFNPETRIEFEIPNTYRGKIKIAVFNIRGQHLRTLAEKQFEPGVHHVNWDGKDSRGQAIASGVYLYGILSGQASEFKKMVLLR